MRRIAAEHWASGSLPAQPQQREAFSAPLQQHQNALASAELQAEHQVAYDGPHPATDVVAIPFATQDFSRDYHNTCPAQQYPRPHSSLACVNVHSRNPSPDLISEPEIHQLDDDINSVKALLREQQQEAVHPTTTSRSQHMHHSAQPTPRMSPATSPHRKTFRDMVRDSCSCLISEIHCCLLVQPCWQLKLLSHCSLVHTEKHLQAAIWYGWADRSQFPPLVSERQGFVSPAAQTVHRAVCNSEHFLSTELFGKMNYFLYVTSVHCLSRSMQVQLPHRSTRVTATRASEASPSGARARTASPLRRMPHGADGYTYDLVPTEQASRAVQHSGLQRGEAGRLQGKLRSAELRAVGLGETIKVLEASLKVKDDTINRLEGIVAVGV